jgi:hypothetical protein
MAYMSGRPRHYEMPLHLPSHDALPFVDALVTTPDGELASGPTSRPDGGQLRWYRERFVATFTPLVARAPSACSSLMARR